MCKPFFLNANQSSEDIFEGVQYENGTFDFRVKDDLKRCSKCLYYKNKFTDFHRNYSAKDSTQGYCKECTKALYKKRKNFELYEQLSYDYEQLSSDYQYGRGVFA